MERAAVIGAGPGGIVAARWLKHEGFEPVLFDQGSRLGGQWTGDPRYSGVWPAMRTNTSHVMTAFSDMPHDARSGVYPTNQAMCAYLAAYAEHHDLLRSARLATTVRQVTRARQPSTAAALGTPPPEKAGWCVRFTTADGSGEEVFPRVVVASGRHCTPAFPVVPGLESFSGIGGVRHTFEYKEPERYRGLRVLVAGCNISALEIASDTAMLGAARVVVSNRRQRYVLPRLVAGVPIDHLAYTRFSAMFAESMPPETVAARMKQFVLRVAGSPAQVGAPAPNEDFVEAGIALSQHFLFLVAEGRIEIRPWLDAVDGRTVRFADGTSEQFDAIIMGTGYLLELPFLSSEIRQTVALDGRYIDLHTFTFHPELPGLAFVGIRQTMGPNLPLMELQSRWIAYAWSGTRPMPSREEMQAGVQVCRAQRGTSADLPIHLAALAVAREAGVEPPLDRWPDLTRALLFGPLTPPSFRLSGPDSLPDAPRRTREAAAAFNVIATPNLTPAECAQLKALAAARNDAEFRRFVEQAASALAPA